MKSQASVRGKYNLMSFPSAATLASYVDPNELDEPVLNVK